VEDHQDGEAKPADAFLAYHLLQISRLQMTDVISARASTIEPVWEAPR
jgi:hypothetical protein